jgi:putative membrane protein
MNSETSPEKESGNATGFEVKPTSDCHFAWTRTRLSADSSLMGWMRLATTLIGFGFTIVQFFDRLGNMALAPQLPRYLGLALIFSGVFGLLIAIWQYIWFVNYLHSEEFSRLVIKPALPINRPNAGHRGCLGSDRCSSFCERHFQAIMSPDGTSRAVSRSGEAQALPPQTRSLQGSKPACKALKA